MERTKKMLSELAKQFPHIAPNHISCVVRDYKTERGYLARLSRENEENKAAHEEPLPVGMTIEVEWHKNHTWGNCPRVELTWETEDGHSHRDYNAGYASGWGYDKLSSAVADALNKHFKNILYAIRNRSTKNKPYGLSYYKGSFPHFEGGVGMECYYRVFAWLGYKMVCVASGKTYDVYEVTRVTKGLKPTKSYK